MSPTLTIARREISSLFFSPVGYIVLALFALGATLLFLVSFGPGQEASLGDLYASVVWILVLLAPLITMRLVSEELRSGSVELLMTSPVSDAQVILGKWLGALGFHVVLLTPLLVLIAVVRYNARVDYGPILTGLLGLVLVGGLYLAIGTFASTLTQNQIIAAVVTMTILVVLTIGLYLLVRANWLSPGLRDAVYYINVHQQFEDFRRGLVDLGRLVYFGSGIALFLFFAVLSLQSRRWR
jgi:ABC-2 type transport system permease protein